ncbi:Atxe2 family lasso peptide isopeptidase [Sphingobium sp. AntQ-1]|uniref:Atxe2 family lasso peptide isopeptidase n=1 Tax=Sphingobium sp. AntQ-1 TaxID=2930091 RepID=UPI00234F7CE0|nr:Atxe2 family lasso peptide isopeptidase [Sphingobium sp. AntQ-1]
MSLTLAQSSDTARAAAPCADVVPPTGAVSVSAKREVRPEDLLGLRDIGPYEAIGPLFTISPDGSSVVLQLRKADAGSNSYCQAIMIVPLSGARPIVVDQGGDLIRAEIVGVADLTVGSGISEIITPLWSADGQWVAFLKKEDGRVQVWKARSDGTGSEPLTKSQSDVVRFALTPDGGSLVFVTQPEIARQRIAVQREGLGGFHYDDRFIPIADSKPQLPGTLTESVEALDLATGSIRPATDPERALLSLPSLMRPKSAGYIPIDRRSRQAWVEAAGGNFATPDTTVRYQSSTGAVIPCANALCSQARAPAWLTGNGSRVIFLRREGWANGTTGIYEWVPGQSAPKRILQTTDYLADCRPIADALLCLREAATEPRRLVRIDLQTRKVTTIFDPNPEWAKLSFGRVRRMNVRNDFGLESTADLVYPAQYRAGQRYPAIVVQYVSRGHLRGGVGDEYPILALAAKGYAVLSVNRPPHLGLLAGAGNLIAAERTNLQNWANRKSILSSIETPLRELIAEGLIDPKKIGITGLSDGATTVQYAMLHSSMFAAAIMSGCCWERNQGALLGPQIDRTFSQVGYPNLLASAPEFWRQISIVENAQAIGIPLLLQAADSEYLSALEAYTALRQAHKPVDLFVFPNEFHNKWQPAHRLAIYRRTLRWFDFWLKGEVPSGGEDAKEVQFWRDLRAGQLGAEQGPLGSVN